MFLLSHFLKEKNSAETSIRKYIPSFLSYIQGKHYDFYQKNVRSHSANPKLPCFGASRVNQPLFVKCGVTNWIFGSFQKAKKPNGPSRVNWPLFVERCKKKTGFSGFFKQLNSLIKSFTKLEKKITK